jgi:acetyl esterase/lipase
MSFESLDLERPVAPHMNGRFNIIIGTNCVHATSDKVATTSRIRKMLNNDGSMVLSEVTRIIDLYDLVFGMLEGWWLADGGTSYPLQPAEAWMTTSRRTGFSSGMFSQGTSEDSNTQQLLIGCTRQITDPSGESFMQPVATLHEKQTVVYKQVGDVQIEADIYLPTKAPTAPMPLALMLHGGGHMTLSRKAIRPAQTAYLLANGILPISLDYRLCPETNLIDGAMTDVRDAFVWARSSLPSVLSSKGITVDSERVAVIGWSTGGHLAMSTAWTVGTAGETPPKAILSFYAPTGFLSRDAFTSRGASLVPHSMSRERILEANLLDPISYYNINSGESPELGWVKSGDPRSELLLSLFRESKEYGLALMLNGKFGTQRSTEKLLSEPPSLQKQAAICPKARLRAGEYDVPTYLNHGDQDEIASFEAASKFQEEMSQKGIKSGFLAVKNGHHIHDLLLKPGTMKWDEEVEPGYRFLFDTLKI